MESTQIEHFNFLNHFRDPSFNINTEIYLLIKVDEKLYPQVSRMIVNIETPFTESPFSIAEKTEHQTYTYVKFQIKPSLIDWDVYIPYKKREGGRFAILQSREMIFDLHTEENIGSLHIHIRGILQLDIRLRVDPSEHFDYFEYNNDLYTPSAEIIPVGMIKNNPPFALKIQKTEEGYYEAHKSGTHTKPAKKTFI